MSTGLIPYTFIRHVSKLNILFPYNIAILNVKYGFFALCLRSHTNNEADIFELSVIEKKLSQMY